ncbi:MFS transporter, partial [Pseudomonas paraeruginosa]
EQAPALLVAAPEPQAPPAPRNAELDLETVQVEPERYRQRLVKATTLRGRIAEGRFTGLDGEGRLVIRREMPGAGEASYLLRPAEIARLELLER